MPAGLGPAVHVALRVTDAEQPRLGMLHDLGLRLAANRPQHVHGLREDEKRMAGSRRGQTSLAPRNADRAIGQHEAQQQRRQQRRLAVLAGHAEQARAIGGVDAVPFQHKPHIVPLEVV